MPNTIESENNDKISNIYHEKVKKDIVKLIELKRKETDLNVLKTLKNKLYIIM